MRVIDVPPSTPSTININIPNVPFYSQFEDITSQKWQKVACGVVSLAMVIDYYKPAVSVDKLLNQAVASGAYNKSLGWMHKGIIDLSKKYGLKGIAYDLTKSTRDAAYSQFKNSLNTGPVIASVHYKIDPKNPVPHLIVIDAIKNGIVYYNDPAAKSGKKEISVANFLKAWKQKFIVLRPVA